MRPCSASALGRPRASGAGPIRRFGDTRVVKFIERIRVIDEAGAAREIRVWQEVDEDGRPSATGAKRLELDDGSFVRELADGAWEDLVRHRYRRA
jgi:hypothetical protein